MPQNTSTLTAHVPAVVPRVGAWSRRTAAAVVGLARPTRPSARWCRRAVLLVAGAIAFNVLVAWAGHRWHANPGRYFGERRVGTLVPVAALVAAGVLCLRASGRLRPDPFGRFWHWAGVLFIFAGCDDLFRFHELADRYAHRGLGLDENHRLTDHLDDLLVALYVVPAAVLGVRHLPRLLGLTWTVVTLAAAFACFVVMAVLDWTGGAKHIEDGFKVMTAVLILTAVLAALDDPNLRPADAADRPAA